MSEAPALGQVVLDDENPWPGLHEFDERGREFFNGRDQEITDLLRLVNDAPLTVLFGASGLGKTSLLRAGLVPKLREQNKLSVYVRLDLRDRAAPLVEQAAAAFRAELAAQEVDHQPFAGGETLWEYLHHSEFELWSKRNQLLTPVFIFDQFEEVFTLGKENAQAVERLREDLADLVENRVPGPLARQFEDPTAEPPQLDLQSRHFKMVLSLREDFLPEIESWRRAIPSVARNRFRLRPMNGQQALAAVTKTGGRLVDETIGPAIVSFVAAARARLHADPSQAAVASDGAIDTTDLAQVTIEPALLSLVCTGLNERRKAAHKATIDQALLSGTGEAIVTEFYEACVRDLPHRTRRFIEDELITESGFRNPYPREDAIARGYLSDPLLQDLVNRRLLRVERHLGTDRIELIHDRLTAVVRTFRDQERARSRREAEVANIRRYRQRTMVAAAGGIAAAIVALVFLRMWWQVDEAFEKYRNEHEQRRIAEQLNEQMRSVADADKKRAGALTVAGQKNYDQAIMLLTDPLTVYAKVEDASRTIRALVDRGRIYALAGKPDLASRDFEQALDTAGRLRSTGDEALALESLAWLRDSADEKDAVSLYQQALEKYRAVAEPLSIGRIFEWIATREEKGHRLDNALANYRSALESYLVAGEKMGAVRVEQAISRTSDWGALVDLKRGKVFAMRGERIAIGRDTPDIHNDLSFADRVVSRRHLVISHASFQADDVRSLNGTAINGDVLPYGLGTKLSDGDIIALANAEVLQFTTQPPAPPSIPTSAWAIFIDGSKRSFTYLTEPVYSVEPIYSVEQIPEGGQRVDVSGLRIEAGDAPSAPLKIRRGRQKTELFAGGEWSVVVTMKQNDYNYQRQNLPSRQWREVFDPPARVTKTNGKLTISAAFQVVTMTRD